MSTTALQTQRDNAAKLSIFKRCFSGLTHVYGTYDPETGKVRQVKAPVNDAVFLAHLTGRQSYGVYLLVGDKTRAVVADFDHDDLAALISFVSAAANYGLCAYIERSKRKGFHCWIFLSIEGVSAWKARVVVRQILNEIGFPNTEVFPKQDRLSGITHYGNFIHTPLFLPHVRRDRTVFLDPADRTKPAPNQWDLLDTVVRVSESQLDELIEINDWHQSAAGEGPDAPDDTNSGNSTFMLPPCAQRMLREGVTSNQRVACFRLAVQLKRVGLPLDLASTTLQSWSMRNKPEGGKRIITPAEVDVQTRCAYVGSYRSFGCEDPAVMAFCDANCPVHGKRGAQTACGGESSTS